MLFSCTSLNSLPAGGGGGALLLGLIAPSGASPTAPVSQATGLEGELSHGSSNCAESTMSFLGSGGDVRLAVRFEFLNDGCLWWAGGSGGGVTDKGEIGTKITKQIKWKKC